MHRPLKKKSIPESNTIAKKVLLFVFALSAIHVHASVADTIIVDGRVVIVETREVEKNPLDTLNKDAGDNKGKESKWSLGVNASAIGTFGKSSTDKNGFSTLNSFIGEPTSICPGYEVDLRVGYRVSENVLLSGGIGFHKMCFRNKFLEAPSLQPDSLRMSFIRFEKGTLDEIALYYIDPGFETDTFSVKLNDGDLVLSGLQFPIELQYEFRDSERDESFLITGLSVLLQFSTTTQGGDFVLVNANGEYEIFSLDAIKTRKLNVAVVPFVGYTVHPHYHWQIDARIGCEFYPTSINENSAFEWTAFSPTLSIRAMYRFGQGN